MNFLRPGDWQDKAIQVSMTSEELDTWRRRDFLTPVEIAVNEGNETIAHYFLVGNSGIRMIVYEAKGQLTEVQTHERLVELCDQIRKLDMTDSDRDYLENEVREINA